MKYYSKDPYWTTARFDSACQCGKPVKRGERMFYYPNGKVVCGQACGCAEKASADFTAYAQDEALMSGNY